MIPLGGTGRQNQGFTLVEMIVTIGIIIVAAGFIAPAVTAIFKDRRIENAAAVIITTVNEARNAAVTKKQKHSVVFLRSGVRLYRHPKGDDDGGFVGGVRSINVPGADHITYDIPCARLDSIDLAEKIQSQVEDLAQNDWKLFREDTFITLRTDGTIDFETNVDIPTYRYNSDPPAGADLIIRQRGDSRACFVDIRPTGRVKSKVVDEEFE
ncbi:MAG: prepilin-type N-terminal cleavage/methylation domain-containing protein [Planctomycetota bacterium]|nr:prepilin-type N-terminal cleavage/methylation domain-containing protein [Planctomycetota bacterium]